MERRYLVLTNRTLGHPQLERRLLALQADDIAGFHLLVPLEASDVHDVTHSEHLRWTGEQARVTTARLRLRRGLARLADLGLDVSGEVSAEDPLRAAARALAHDRYDGIVVSTLPARMSRWVRMDVPARLRRRCAVPVIHVEVTDARVDDPPSRV